MNFPFGTNGKFIFLVSQYLSTLKYSDRQILVEETALALGISQGSVSTILHDRLGMRKPTACWVPKSLSNEQIATRASVCSALLKHSRSKDFLSRLVTVDET